jgi:hypothetical protein
VSLMDRIAARRCAHVECTEDRAPDAQLCPRHLLDLYRNLLDRDGSTYVPRRRFRAVDLTGRVAA